MFNLKLYRKEYYLKHKNKLKKRSRKWYKNNKKQQQERMKIYNQTHKKEIRDCYLKNRKKLKKRQKRYERNRRKTDINFKILHNLRDGIRRVLKEHTKSLKTIKLLGCNVIFLKNYLESKFKLEMSWDNYGRGWNGKGMEEWHIDHIRPCCSFNLSKVSEQKKCFHYTNLQPLWASENRKKWNKY